MDLAASIQVVIEEIIIKLAITLKEETGINNLCLAGGVALSGVWAPTPHLPVRTSSNASCNAATEAVARFYPKSARCRPASLQRQWQHRQKPIKILPVAEKAHQQLQIVASARAIKIRKTPSDPWLPPPLALNLPLLSKIIASVKFQISERFRHHSESRRLSL